MSYLVNGDDFGLWIEDENILSGYRPTKQIKIKLTKNEDNDDLSDYVLKGLFVARTLAMIKFYEKGG